MAAVDALSLQDGSGASSARRWAAGVSVALAIHGGAYLYLNRAPAPVGFESQAPIELDLLPPPSGAAQMDEAGANATQEARPEETPETQTEETPEEQTLDEIDPVEPDEVTPPDETEVTAAEVPPEELEPVETPQVAEMEIPPDVTAAPPDVEPAVTLPPQETVVAREVEPEPAPKPAPKPVAKKPETKPEPRPRREEPRPRPVREAKPAERPAPAQMNSQAGGQSGASANAGAARAAASAYGSRVRAAVAAQKRSGGSLSGRATVSFTVTRSGAVTGVSASGPGPVAAEAAAMVRRAGIPAMPPEMTGSSARYTLPITFSAGR